MYDKLLKRLREADEKSMCGECGLNLHTGATKKGVLFAEAADAIEELQRSLDGVCADNDSLCNKVEELSKYAETMRMLKCEGWYLQQTKFHDGCQAVSTRLLPEPPKEET